MSNLLKKLVRSIPLFVLIAVLYSEWQGALYEASNTAHWAHIGGALGAWLYLK